MAIHAEDEPSIRRNMARPWPVWRRYSDGAAPVYRARRLAGYPQAMQWPWQKRHSRMCSTSPHANGLNTGTVGVQAHAAEACVHHLRFTDADYKKKGALIEWNPQ